MSATVIDPAYVDQLKTTIRIYSEASQNAATLIQKLESRIDQQEKIERGHETVIYNLLFAIGRHLNGDDGPLHKAIDDACTALSFSNHLPPQG